MFRGFLVLRRKSIFPVSCSTNGTNSSIIRQLPARSFSSLVVAKKRKIFGAKLSAPRRTLQRQFFLWEDGGAPIHLNPLSRNALNVSRRWNSLGKWNKLPSNLTSFSSHQRKAVPICFPNNVQKETEKCLAINSWRSHESWEVAEFVFLRIMARELVEVPQQNRGEF